MGSSPVREEIDDHQLVASFLEARVEIVLCELPQIRVVPCAATEVACSSGHHEPSRAAAAVLPAALGRGAR